MKKSDGIRVAHISDIHLFHPRNPTEEILEKLEKHVFSLDVDLLIFVGDIFDNLASLFNSPVWMVFDFARKLVRWAEETNTVVRILKGTHRHDWNQNMIFEVTRKSMGSTMVAIRDLVEVEHIPSLGLDLLYVPDNYSPTAESTYKIVQDTVKNTPDGKVDIVCMHGAFDYQMVGIAESVHTHSSEAYSELARCMVVCGHVHQSSVHGNILVQGSFDRLSHNDEDKKGYFISTVYPKESSFTTEFVVNEDAKLYRSVVITGMPVEEGIRKVLKTAETLPDGSFIRIVDDGDSAVYQGWGEFISRFPLLKWSRAIKKKKVKSVAKKEDTVNKIPPITKDNIVELVMGKARNKESNGVTEAELRAALLDVIENM